MWKDVTAPQDLFSEVKMKKELKRHWYENCTDGMYYVKPHILIYTTHVNKFSSFCYVLFGIQNKFQVATKQNKSDDSRTYRLSDNSVVFPYKMRVHFLRPKKWHLEIFCMRTTNT